MEKPRYIVLTDIFHGFEVDDIQSMIRLMLYSNEIDIEGLIACTSCFVKHHADRHVSVIHEVIDGYEKVLPNLKVHADGYPSPEYLRSITCDGISEFGSRPHHGFADSKYNDNAGVKRIIEAVDKEDDRPLYIGLWGGANTLAQAIWQVAQTRSLKQLDKFLSKLRIYGISDQDNSAHWIRDNYGDKLFYIVSPSKGTWSGNFSYWRATWPGISSDHFQHGSEDGTKTKGFTGAAEEMISNQWIKEQIQSKGILGRLYPKTRYILEGDTPTYLGLIPNGLNVPERPDYGGWGGRYTFYLPTEKQCGIKEKFPIWTNSSDQVMGEDNKPRRSPQATIWRWRRAFQNDMVARLNWSITDTFQKAQHPLSITSEKTSFQARKGESLTLTAAVEDKDENGFETKWYIYPEAGSFKGQTEIKSEGTKATVLINEVSKEGELHILMEATTKGTLALTKYIRFIINISE